MQDHNYIQRIDLRKRKFDESYLVKTLKSRGKRQLLIELPELNQSVNYAIANALQSISDEYEASTRGGMDAPKFKLTLHAIACCPREPVQHSQIRRLVAAALESTPAEVNVSHQLACLERDEVIDRVSRGLYKFRNPLFRAYVILRTKAEDLQQGTADRGAHIS